MSRQEWHGDLWIYITLTCISTYNVDSWRSFTLNNECLTTTSRYQQYTSLLCHSIMLRYVRILPLLMLIKTSLASSEENKIIKPDIFINKTVPINEISCLGQDEGPRGWRNDCGAIIYEFQSDARFGSIFIFGDQPGGLNLPWYYPPRDTGISPRACEFRIEQREGSRDFATITKHRVRQTLEEIMKACIDPPKVFTSGSQTDLGTFKALRLVLGKYPLSFRSPGNTLFIF